LRYTPRARRHLDAISEYITKRNPDAARRVGARIRETIDLLVAFPDIATKERSRERAKWSCRDCLTLSSIALKLAMRTRSSF
jgi:plasmid stabilization system protein ParE